MAKKKVKKESTKAVEAPKVSSIDKLINSLEDLSHDDLNRVINACRGHLAAN